MYQSESKVTFTVSQAADPYSNTKPCSYAVQPEISSTDGRQYTDHDICDHPDRCSCMYWRNPYIPQKEKIKQNYK